MIGSLENQKGRITQFTTINNNNAPSVAPKAPRKSSLKSSEGKSGKKEDEDGVKVKKRKATSVKLADTGIAPEATNHEDSPETMMLQHFRSMYFSGLLMKSTQLLANNAILRFIARYNLPLTVVEDPSFIKMIQTLSLTDESFSLKNVAREAELNSIPLSLQIQRKPHFQNERTTEEAFLDPNLFDLNFSPTFEEGDGENFFAMPELNDFQSSNDTYDTSTNYQTKKFQKTTSK